MLNVKVKVENKLKMLGCNRMIFLYYFFHTLNGTLKLYHAEILTLITIESDS